MKQRNTTVKKTKLNTPKVVDLFSGCGGLSYGFNLAGFDITLGAEIDEQACYTASYNIHWRQGKNKEHLNIDIKNLRLDDLSNFSEPLMTIGGPPCQAYSRIGRSKLKSLGLHRFGLNDDRAFLYEEFIRVALEADSEAIVMENVPESVNFLNMNIPQIVCDTLEQNGYNAVWTILNSANFGVPQARERVFVIATKEKYGEIEHLPLPTHIQSKEMTSEKMLSKYKKFNDFPNFRNPLMAGKDAPIWVTVDDALSDLPALFPNSNSKLVIHNMNKKLPYQTPPLNNYQKFMRRLDDKSFGQEVDANSFRKTMRDFRIFEKMGPGDDYRKASEIATNLFKEACAYYNVSKNDKEAYEKLKKEYVPPYDTTKFHSKWKKLSPDKSSHTLVAHLGTDTYSHIHPYEPRGISVREAARLQSFPDDFKFNVPMSSAYKQIGNAVPPLLAKGVAKAVFKNLNLN